MAWVWLLLVWSLPGIVSLWLFRRRVPVTGKETALALLLTPLAIGLGLTLGIVARAKG